jgi:hypothetical protein
LMIDDSLSIINHQSAIINSIGSGSCNNFVIYA